MDFSQLRRIKTTQSKSNYHDDEIYIDYSRRKSENLNTENIIKFVLIIYASGSMGANKQLEIQRGGLQKKMAENFYLCDLDYSKKMDTKLQYLITPVQETGARIRYKVVQMDKIDASVNMRMETILKLAEIISKFYNDCSSFIVVTGLDTICHVGTVLSFMLQNLSKLVICTGGYLPLSRMRNDSVSNLVECFSVVAEASTLNDVLIVCKNKGFRANRCIKMTEGDFQNISSPNLPALCSIKTKLRFRSYLFQSQPTQQFRIFTGMSNKVKVLRMNQYECIESLAYQLKNPYIKGMVIESYSFANIPNLPQILNLFKQCYEDQKTRKIFINISEAVQSKNQSLMKQYLQNYCIYFGSDMTCEAALAKLSYLIGKQYPEQHIIKLMQTNLRGELTEQKQKKQFKVKQTSLIQIVDEVLNEYFPTTLKDLYFHKIQNNVSKFIIDNCTAEQFKQIFSFQNGNRKQYKAGQTCDMYGLLHKTVAAGNLQMTEFFIANAAHINLEDERGCSPLFYAIQTRNKSMIQLLSKNGARVIADVQDLFQMFVQAIAKDDTQFFNLLYHTQFKETMKCIKNAEARTVSHIAGLLKAHKCFKLMREKFNIHVNQQDVYGSTASQYMSNGEQ